MCSLDTCVAPQKKTVHEADPNDAFIDRFTRNETNNGGSYFCITIQSLLKMTKKLCSVFSQFFIPYEPIIKTWIMICPINCNETLVSCLVNYKSWGRLQANQSFLQETLGISLRGFPHRKETWELLWYGWHCYLPVQVILLKARNFNELMYIFLMDWEKQEVLF